MKFLGLALSFCLITFVASAQSINEKYSFKAFPYHGLSFKDRPASEFNNTTIRGTCFYQEWVVGDADVIKDIFPDGMTGVTFISCNLDNIYVDETKNTILKDTTARCSYKKIKVQNDWDDWIVEKKEGKWKPKEPLNKKWRLKRGISIDPKDIPKEKFKKKDRKTFEDQFDNITIIPIP